MWEKINKLSVGVIIGVILPLILYFIIVMPKMRTYSSLGDHYYKIIIEFLPLFLSRCIFPNALVFFLFIWKNQDLAAKGVLISTAALTAALLVLNFIL